jgi:outer membrane receptor protein involved in Fe transport
MPTPRFRFFPHALIATALLAVCADGQTVVPERAEVENASATTDAVKLSPFEVRADEDHGYLATSAQSGTRLRSELKDIAAAVSVVTKDFMNDIGARNAEDLLVYTLNTEVGGAGGNFSESTASSLNGGGEMNYDGAFQSVSPGTRVRGLTSADNTRDFFTTDLPLDSYNVDRVEISRGPNAMLFGLGSPAGIINSALIKAQPGRNSTQLQYRTDQYGSYRGSLDHNQVLIRDRLAVRIATVYDKQYYRIEPAFNQTQRAYLTGTFRPFKNTVLKASTEWASVNSNRPRINPPVDDYTLWWQVGRPTYDLRSGTITLLGTPTLVSPLTATGARNTNVLVTAMGTSGLTNNMTLIYSDPNSHDLGIPGTGAVGYRSGQLANVRLNAAGTALVTDGPMGLADWSRILNQVVYANDPSRNFWKNPQVTDPGIYDFYHHMLDGPNKYEWAEWGTHNLTLEQHFLDDRAGVELSFDRQNLDQGNLLPLSSASAYTLRVDINTHLPNGAPNPNFGRPVMTGFQTNTRTASDRDTWRATGYYNLDLQKVGPTWLGRALGRHLITGTHTRLKNFNERYGATFAVNSGVDYSFANQGNLNDASTQGRDVSLVRYIGPNVSASPTPVGGIVTPTGQWPSGITSVPILWYTSPTTSTPPPAKWEVRNFDLLTNGRKDVNSTRRASGIRRTRDEVNSTVFVTQDRWFNGRLVTTLGWRKDDVHTFDAGTATRDPVTGIGINDPAVLFPKRVAWVSEKTFTWGAVVHAPEFVQRRLPFGSEISLTYNRADNFRPGGQRYDLYDNAIGSEVGETREYGVLLSTFNGRLVFRATHYETSAEKSSSLVNLGTPIQNLADSIERVLDRTAEGVNAGNPAGVAALNQFMQDKYGQILTRTFRLRQSGSGWDYDRRTGQVTATADVVSEGEEFEVVANPTRNWRIAFNASKATAVRNHSGLDLQDIVLNGMVPLVSGPAGQLLQETNGTLFGNAIRQNVLVPMLQVTSQDGSPTSELRRWHWNAVTNYRFTGGRLRGWNVGAAARWQDKVAIGFPVIVDPVAGAVPDVRHPYYGPTEVNYDGWIGYSRKLGQRYAWSIQLNVKNLGRGNELISVNVQPDGSPNSWRIAEAQKWTLTNTISF